MKNVFLLTLFCCMTVCLLASASESDRRNFNMRGYYVGKAERTREPIELDIFGAYDGETFFIDFMVTDNPPGHILGSVSEAYNIKKNKFNFIFMDKQGKKGRGLFSRRGKKYVLHLERPRTSPSGSVTGYSSKDYVVVRQDTVTKVDRHPWSLGRKSSGPGISSKPRGLYYSGTY